MRRPKSPLTPALARDMQAPLPVQTDLEDLIAEAKRASDTRETLKGSVEAQRRASRLQAMISAEMAKKRDQGKRKNAPPQDNGPTPERAAKLMGVEEISPPIKDDGTRALAKAHLAQGVVEFYRDNWSYEELQGARYLVTVWDKAAKGMPRMSANYDGTPGTSFGPRQGGVAAHTLDAHNQLLNIEAIVFTNFGVKGLNLVKWFAWETLLFAETGASLGRRMEMAGRALAPFVSEKSRDRLWGITFGHLQAIFRFAYAEWVVREEAMRRKDSSPEQVRMRLAQRRRRMEGER